MKILCRDCYEQLPPDPHCKRCGGTGQIETDIAPDPAAYAVPIVNVTLSESSLANEVAALKLRVSSLENMIELLTDGMRYSISYETFRRCVDDANERAAYFARKDNKEKTDGR